MCLEICYHRDLEVDVLTEAADKILARQNEPDRLSRIAAQAQTLHAAYQAVRRGDHYSLCRDTDRLTLALNGRPLASIADDIFARAYLDIWLGEQPLSESLRDELLRNDGKVVAESKSGSYR